MCMVLKKDYSMEALHWFTHTFDIAFSLQVILFTTLFHHQFIHSNFFLLESIFKFMYLKIRSKNFGRKRKTFPKHSQF